MFGEYMKKLLFIFCCIFILPGCGRKRLLYCDASAELEDYSIDLSYQIEHDGKYVSRILSTEKVFSEDEYLLMSFQDMINEDQDIYKGLKHYKHSTNISDGVLTSIVDINYKKINTTKMINLDSNNENLIKNGKVSIDDIKLYYEDLGTTCYE